MELEELYAPNHIERLKARSFLRSIAFFDDFSASFEYRDLFSVLENIAQFDYKKIRIKMICIFCANLWSQP